MPGPPRPSPEQHPAEPPAEHPAEPPAERPARRPAARPARQPSDRPTEQPSERLAGHSPNRPTDRSTNRPTDRPAEQPSERLAGHSPSRPTDRPTDRPVQRPAKDAVTDVVRWAAFSCVLVPVALLWYGTSLAGAAGTALGLAAVTAVCRLLLHRSERRAAGARGGGRHTGGSTPVN